MENNHTKGPWEAQPKLAHQDFIEIHHKNNSPGAASFVLARVTVRQSWLGEQQDNARLIAAAPDLLDVCQRLLEAVPYVSEYDVPIGLWEDLRGAVAKAKPERQS